MRHRSSRISPVLGVFLFVASGCSPRGVSSELPSVLPTAATTDLAASLERAAAHTDHPWADVPPFRADGVVNAYVEIARGDRREWELDIGASRRIVDRWIPAETGGYPVNYGFMPQTIFLDGDPLDALVLGPPLAGGELTTGIVVGLMMMEDTGVVDSKVVLSPAAADGEPSQALTDSERRIIADYFRRYKEDQAGSATSVPGWGSAAEGLAHVRRAHAFFVQCGVRAGAACDVSARQVRTAGSGVRFGSAIMGALCRGRCSLPFSDAASSRACTAGTSELSAETWCAATRAVTPRAPTRSAGGTAAPARIQAMRPPSAIPPWTLSSLPCRRAFISSSPSRRSRPASTSSSRNRVS